MKLLKALAWSAVALAVIAVGYVVFFAGIEAALRWYFLAVNFTANKVPNFAHNLRLGAEITIKLTVISSVTGLFLGLFAGIARLSKNPLFRWPAQFYIWVIRGTPLLVQILFAYNALPFLLEPAWKYLQPLGVPPIQDVLTPYWAAFIALSVNVGAYNAEVIRAGIQAIAKGQWEAAMSLGMRPVQVMRYIIVPQAIKIVVPPLVNNVIALLKDSSLASVITLLELVHQGQRMISITFRPVEVYVAVAAIYLILTTVLTFFTDWLEREMARRGAET
ncbi:amino acid ABC transporter permease [Oceanithermus sp.]|uniref:amino acid ABC transporter permease n=1 Tax=Oceanithermus sp. TaxID=2268145 RepID=UPI00257CEDFE|nr:amino acid ABC transporter permease [Oceanithermus sp.]